MHPLQLLPSRDRGLCVSTWNGEIMWQLQPTGLVGVILLQLPPLVYLLLELWAVMWAVWSLRLPGCEATQTSSSGEPLRLPERVPCLHPLTATAHAPPPVPLPAMARLQPYWRPKPDPLAESSQNFWPRETVRNNKMVVTVWSHHGFETTFCTTITNQNLHAYKVRG